MNDVKKVLLEHLIKIEEFGDRKIFYVDKEGFLVLIEAKEKEIKRLIEEGLSETIAKREALKEHFKIINPVKEGIKVAGYGYITAYSSVVDKQKILERYLEEEFLKFKRNMYRNLKKELKKAQSEKEK